MHLQKLENILLENNLIPLKTLQLIKRECVATALPIADGLLNLGLITEDELTQLLANHTRYKIAQSQPQANLWNQVDADIFIALHCVPILLHEKTLTVGMIDPTDYFQREQLGFLTGFRIKPVIMQRSIIQTLLREVDPHFQSESQNIFEIFGKKFAQKNNPASIPSTQNTVPVNYSAPSFSQPQDYSPNEAMLDVLEPFHVPDQENEELGMVAMNEGKMPPILEDQPQDFSQTLSQEMIDATLAGLPISENADVAPQDFSQTLSQEIIDSTLAGLSKEAETAQFESSPSPKASIDAMFENLSEISPEETIAADEVDYEVDYDLASKVTSALNRLIIKIHAQTSLEQVNILLQKNIDFEALPAILIGHGEKIIAGWKKDPIATVYRSNLQLAIEDERKDLQAFEGSCVMVEKALKNEYFALVLIERKIAKHEVVQDLLGKLLERLKSLK